MKTLQANGFTDWLVTIGCTLLAFSGLPIKMRSQNLKIKIS